MAHPGPDYDPFGRPLIDDEPDQSEPAQRQRAEDAAFQANARQKATRRRDNDVVRLLMRTKNGRDWVYRKLEACHIFGAVADLGTRNRNSDPFVTYFRDGERNVGNSLLQDVQLASGDLYLTMIKEHAPADEGAAPEGQE